MNATIQKIALTIGIALSAFTSIAEVHQRQIVETTQVSRNLLTNETILQWQIALQVGSNTVFLSAGANVTIATNGNLFTISSTGGGSGHFVAAGANVTMVTNGSLVTISASASGGGFTNNLLTANRLIGTDTNKGQVSIQPGTGLALSGNQLIISNFGSSNIVDMVNLVPSPTDFLIRTNGQNISLFRNPITSDSINLNNLPHMWRQINNGTGPIFMGQMGDSMAGHIPAIASGTWQWAFGANGGLFSGDAQIVHNIAGGANFVTPSAQTPNSVWPWTYVNLPSGGSILYTNAQGFPVPGDLNCDNIQVYYLMGPSEGTFKVQTNTGGGAFTDVLTVDASNGSLVGGYTNLGAIPLGFRTFKVVGVSGTCNILGAGAWWSGTNAYTAVPMFENGTSVSNWVTVSKSILVPILTNVPMTCAWIAWKDDGDVPTNVYKSTYYAFLDRLTNCFPKSDFLFIGAIPSTNLTGSQDLALQYENAVQREACSILGWAYWDGHSTFQTASNAVDNGWMADGIHPTFSGDLYNMQFLYRDIGLTKSDKIRYASKVVLGYPPMLGESSGSALSISNGINVLSGDTILNGRIVGTIWNTSPTFLDDPVMDIYARNLQTHAHSPMAKWGIKNMVTGNSSNLMTLDRSASLTLNDPNGPGSGTPVILTINGSDAGGVLFTKDYVDSVTSEFASAARGTIIGSISTSPINFEIAAGPFGRINSIGGWRIGSITNDNSTPPGWLVADGLSALSFTLTNRFYGTNGGRSYIQAIPTSGKSGFSFVTTNGAGSEIEAANITSEYISSPAGYFPNLTNVFGFYGNYFQATNLSILGTATNELGDLQVTNAAIFNKGVISARGNLSAPTSITFPNTTVNWTNPINCNIQVYIDNTGVTGTALAKNGTTIFTTIAGSATIGLQVGEYFSETYTVGTPSAKYSAF